MQESDVESSTSDNNFFVNTLQKTNQIFLHSEASTTYERRLALADKGSACETRISLYTNIVEMT